MPLQIAGLIHLELLTDFFNKIGPKRPFATANYRIAKEVYSIASSARASNAGGLDNCWAGPSGV